jgi:nucleotide-binding universal stress UspA family protein
MRRILCAIDHSEPSLRAATLATELAGQCKAKLLLLKVVHLPDATQRDITDYLRREHSSDPPGALVLDSAQDELALLSDQLEREGGIAVTSAVRAGEAATEIAAAARDHAIDLIVIGHRGHNRLAQVLLGSVAKRVVETAPCPVLIVR